MIHCSWLLVAPMSSTRRGIATLSTVLSSVMITRLRHRVTRVNQRRACTRSSRTSLGGVASDMGAFRYETVSYLNPWGRAPVQTPQPLATRSSRRIGGAACLQHRRDHLAVGLAAARLHHR